LQDHNLYTDPRYREPVYRKTGEYLKGVFSCLDRSRRIGVGAPGMARGKSTPSPSSPRRHELLADSALSRNRHARDGHLFVVASRGGPVCACSRQCRRAVASQEHQPTLALAKIRPRSAQPRPQCGPRLVTHWLHRPPLQSHTGSFAVVRCGVPNGILFRKRHSRRPCHLYRRRSVWQPAICLQTSSARRP